MTYVDLSLSGTDLASCCSHLSLRCLPGSIGRQVEFLTETRQEKRRAGFLQEAAHRQSTCSFILALYWIEELPCQNC